MKLFKVILSAGQTQQLDVVGSYYRALTASAPFSIGTDDGDMQAIAQGIGEHTEKPFTRLHIYSATAQTIVLAISRGRVDDARLSIINAVNVIDGGIERTKQKKTFSKFALVPAVSAQYAHLELYNPPGSGVNLVLSQLALAYSGGSECWAYLGDTAATLWPAPMTGVTTVYGEARYADGNFVLSKGIINYKNSASSQVPSYSGTSHSVFAISNTTFGMLDHKFAEPFVIAPGSALRMIGYDANANIKTMLEWYEETL